MIIAYCSITPHSFQRACDSVYSKAVSLFDKGCSVTDDWLSIILMRLFKRDTYDGKPFTIGVSESRH